MRENEYVGIKIALALDCVRMNIYICLYEKCGCLNNTSLALHSMLCFVQINSTFLKLNLLCLELDLTFFSLFKFFLD